jgi:predicted RNase H-like nuclease (RuvC/YqgF family)
MATEKKVSTPDEKTPEVDRIRDIIFGSHMRTYDGNFQTIQRDLDRLQQEIERLNEKLIEQEESQSQKVQALEREIRKVDDRLRTELRETAQKLTDEKVDRQMLGDLFIELGNQLKSNGSLAGALKEILEPKED